MRKMLKGRLLYGSLILIVIMGLTLTVLAMGADSDKFSINENGETYGSAANATSPKTEPDLISVLGTGGKSGYVKKSDLYKDDFQTEEEMEYYMAEVFGKGPRYIPVYESDGKTVIDEFMIGVPPSKDVVAEMGRPDGTRVLMLADGSYALPDGTELIVLDNGDLALPDGTVFWEK